MSAASRQAIEFTVYGATASEVSDNLDEILERYCGDEWKVYEWYSVSVRPTEFQAPLHLPVRWRADAVVTVYKAAS